METMNAEQETTTETTRAAGHVPRSPRTTNRPRRLQRGFTLIELIVVVTIIGILAGIAIANVKNAQNKAREAALKDDLREMRSAIDNFYADKQRYPQSLAELKDSKYLRTIPKDPMTGKAEWEEVQAQVDTGGDSNPNPQVDPTANAGADQNGGQPGIYDVKSMAEGKSLNGEDYKSW
jgi:general secretion pathway protein G